MLGTLISLSVRIGTLKISSYAMKGFEFTPHTHPLPNNQHPLRFTGKKVRFQRFDNLVIGWKSGYHIEVRQLNFFFWTNTLKSSFLMVLGIAETGGWQVWEIGEPVAAGHYMHKWQIPGWVTLTSALPESAECPDVIMMHTTREVWSQAWRLLDAIL